MHICRPRNLGARNEESQSQGCNGHAPAVQYGGTDAGGEEADGWSCSGRRYRCVLDVHPSVNLGHLKRLKAAGRMRDSMV
jgi:hypothetical protein